MEQQELERQIRSILDNTEEAYAILEAGNPVNPSLDTVASVIPYIVKYIKIDATEIPMTAVINAIATVSASTHED